MLGLQKEKVKVKWIDQATEKNDTHFFYSIK